MTGKQRKSRQEAAAPASLVREARVARALRAVAAAMGAFVEVDELVELVVDQLSGLMEGSHVVLLLLDERNRQLVSHAGGGRGELSVALDREEGLLSYALRSGRVTRVEDLSVSEFEVEWDESLDIESRSCAVVPLKNNLGRSIGVVLAASEKLAGFDQDDADILLVFAKQAAMAIDNSRLMGSLIRKNQQLSQAQEQLTRRVRDLQLLFELERSTAHAESHEELARAVLEKLARACNAGGALLVLAEEGEADFLDYSLVRAPRVTGELSEAPSSFFVDVSCTREELLAPVFRSKSSVQIDSVDDPVSLSGFGELQSLIAEALEGESDGVLGALALVNRRGGPFTAEDLGLLRLVAANLSTALRLFNVKQAREKEARLSSIGRLLSQVVHDLKSPLTVINGYVQLMEDSSKPVERRRYAAEILKQFQAMGAMQREVLAFARGETQIFARRVIMDRLLGDLSEQMKPELAVKKVELKLNTTKRLIVHLDSERLMRALMNLVRNAAEAMEPSGGTVSIRASGDGKDLTIRVADTGPGIPAEIAPRLFQSFVTAGKSEGTGLGLAIVKRIVEEHGGQVRLCPVTRGACFMLIFPGAVEVAKGSASESATAKKKAPVKKASKKKAPVKKAPKKPAAKKAVKKKPVTKTASLVKKSKKKAGNSKARSSSGRKKP